VGSKYIGITASECAAKGVPLGIAGLSIDVDEGSATGPARVLGLAAGFGLPGEDPT
jgi:hypothetical protein